MWYKRLTAWLLCGLMLMSALPLFAVVSAEEDPMDNFVLGTIHEKKAFSPMSNGYGHGWTRDFTLDLTGVAKENLALSMQFYFQDANDPDNTSLLSAPSRDLRLSAEDSNKHLTWNMAAVKTVDGGDLTPGEWNNILLPLSTASGYNSFNFTTDTITFFWLEFSGMTDPGKYSVRMQNVAVVDTSRRAEVVEEPEWDTTYLVGEIPFTMNATVTGKGASTPVAGTSKSFAAIDASKHDPKQLRLVMDIEVENLTNPGDVSVLTQISGQLELTSGGNCDVEEASVGIQSLNWRSGKNEYTLALSTFTPTGGQLDYSKINYMRIYMLGWPADFTDKLTIKVSNVRLVDVTDEPSLPTLFADDMLFQQNKPMAMWGYGQEGDDITAKLYNGDELLETKNATITESGRWDLAFSAREGGYDTYKIEVLSGDKLIKTINNVLVGELWIACGQSNMELSVATDMDSAEIIANADNPYLRMFLEPTYPLGNTGDQPIDPAEDIPGAIWGRGDNGAQVGKTSSIGYTFIKNLQETLDVPVGLINAAIGGSVIEGWLPREAVEKDAAVKQALQQYGLYYDEEWWSTSAGTMSTLYNQKIGPLEGMGIAGMIWYQGESNSNRSEIYDIELDLLKRSWSEAFGFENGDMPLIFSHVAPHRYNHGSEDQQHLGYLAMYMEKGWALSADKNTAMLPIYDLPLEHMKNGTSSDPIHPRVKTPVAERFFLSAMGMVYGEEIEYTAPVYKEMEIKDNAIYVTFDRVGEGLGSSDWSGRVHGFTIAGEDGVYVNAEAEIVDNTTVKVWNNRVADPKNVMYAFDNYNQAANLYNSSGIPASPFRTVEIADTTMNPDPSIDYFTAQDWMTCDKDVWVFDSTNTEEWSAGYRPSFTLSNGDTYAYDEYLCDEGFAALRVAHSGKATVSPVLTYESVKQAWGNYKYLSVKVMNPDDFDKSLSLKISTTGGKTYTVPTVDGDEEATLAANGDRFQIITFDFSAMKDSSGNTPTVTSALNSLRSMDFTIDTAKSGTVFFDAFSVGMTDAVVSESELNEDAESVLLGEEDLQLIYTICCEMEEFYTLESLVPYFEAKAAFEALIADENATAFALTDAAANMLRAMENAKPIPFEPDDALLGDVNGDEKVNTTDARQILQYAAGILGEDDLNLDVADVNGDGKVNTTDARSILQFAAGIIDHFPAEDM